MKIELTGKAILKKVSFVDMKSFYLFAVGFCISFSLVCDRPVSASREPENPQLFDAPSWIEKRPIRFTSRRVRWTLEYLENHYGVRTDSIRFEPKIIVIHWTASAGLEPTWKIFDPEEMPGGRALLKANGPANVSVPYLIDRDGKIVQMMREDMTARHVIGLNYSAIGIENIGGTKDTMFLSPEQIEANVRLIRYLKKRYPSIEYLIGHREYLSFEKSNHPLWLEKIDSYRTEKIDPDTASLQKIRRAVADLELNGAP